MCFIVSFPSQKSRMEMIFWSTWGRGMEYAVHEITAGHRSLSGTISCVTDRIRFLPVTMTGRFSNFNSISYTEDRHELRVTGTKCRLSDTMSGTGQIFISGTERLTFYLDYFIYLYSNSCFSKWRIHNLVQVDNVLSHMRWRSKISITTMHKSQTITWWSKLW